MQTDNYKVINFNRMKKIVDKPYLFEFVLKMRLRNYESCTNAERKEIEEIFTKGMEMLKASLNSNIDDFDRKTYQIVNDIFKKQDPTFWFNTFTHHYRSEVKIQMEYDKITPYLKGKSIVDIGSGSGRLAAKFSENGYKVYTADIIDYRADIAKDLPFELINSECKTSYPNKVADTSFVILSFHHMDKRSVENTLDEVKRLSNRLIVKEDVYGIPSDNQQFIDVVNSDALLQEFCSFSLEDQFMILMLSDYVSNVFIHGRTDMSFAFEFHSIPEWREIFNQNGLKLVDEELIGLRRGKYSGSCHAYFIVDAI